jgi:hypothetical protein
MTIQELRVALLGLLGLVCAGSIPAAAQPSEQMQFTIVNPTGIAKMVADSSYIYASGIIDAGAASRFQALMAAKSLPVGTLLFLDSPGGNLLAGMELGRDIRADGFDTYVDASNGFDNLGVPASKPSLCASACTLAFLGGRFRFIDENSIYAVHRFYFPGNVGGDSDVAQVVSAEVVQYMRDMGVDPQLFTLMTEAGESEVVIPTRQQLLSFNVVNNGAEKPVWSINAVDQGLYLKGEENTIWGDNKLLFLCARRGTMLLTAIFAARGRETIMNGEHADGLLLDGNVVRFPPSVRVFQVFNKGSAFVSVGLSHSLIQRILKAHTVGFSMQTNFDAGMFDGIADFDFSDGMQKMLGLLSSCH